MFNCKGEFGKNVLFKQVMFQKICKLIENKYYIIYLRVFIGWFREEREIFFRNIVVKSLRVKKNGNFIRNVVGYRLRLK